ncbi:hypothetical protein [Endozoicomonas lisbonensis]|uniref:Uncharacterized protein n=1 Tax=Endozoicomonas lisbonensis TaxID=3120522 RepID=A0ABV2SNC5_9GAMM
MRQINNDLVCIVCNPEAFGAAASSGTPPGSRGPSENYDETQGCCTVAGSGNPAIPALGNMAFGQLIGLFGQEQQIYFAEQLSLGVSEEDILKEMLMELNDDGRASAEASVSGNPSDSPPGLVRSEDNFPGFDDSIDNELLGDLINRIQTEFSASIVDRAGAVCRYKGWDLIQSVLSNKVAKEKVSKRAVKRAGQKAGRNGSARLFHMHSLVVGGGAMDADMENHLLSTVRYVNRAFIIRDEKGNVMMFGSLISDPERERVLFSLGNLPIEIQAGNEMSFLLKIIADLNQSPYISAQLEKIDFYYLCNSADGQSSSSNR